MKSTLPPAPISPSTQLPMPEHSLAMLEQCVREIDLTQGLQLFAYGSLIWRPDCEPVEHLPARVMGYHRCLRMRSRVNRGSPEKPGLVLALMKGGSCRGLWLRVRAQDSEAVLRQLWLREMPTGVYHPRWLNCQTQQGPKRALAFTLLHDSPNWTGPLTDAELIHIFRHAVGRYGSTLDYLHKTVLTLRAHGIHDKELERQWRLARAHGLLSGPASPAVAAGLPVC